MLFLYLCFLALSCFLDTFRGEMESKQTDLWVDLFVTFSAATIITILRLLSRWLRRTPLSWDDYFALCGYVSDFSRALFFQ